MDRNKQYNRDISKQKVEYVNTIEHTSQFSIERAQVSTKCVQFTTEVTVKISSEVTVQFSTEVTVQISSEVTVQ